MSNELSTCVGLNTDYIGDHMYALLGHITREHGLAQEPTIIPCFGIDDRHRTDGLVTQFADDTQDIDKGAAYLLIPSPTGRVTESGDRVFHSVMLGIDKKTKTITYQDPYGTAISDSLRASLDAEFSGFTITDCQKKQEHISRPIDCAPLTIHNIESFLIGREITELDLDDILELRRAQLDILKDSGFEILPDTHQTKVIFKPAPASHSTASPGSAQDGAESHQAAPEI